MGFVILVCLFLSSVPLWAQHDKQDQTAVDEAVPPGHNHHKDADHEAGWEGSVAGIDYSEFNHHQIGRAHV